MFKRIEAGLHQATHGGVTYELNREPPGTRNRQWKLCRLTGDTRSSLDFGFASVSAGTCALEFILSVEKHLRELGASEGKYGWTLETQLGPLAISPYGRRVMMCFDDVARAKVELGGMGFNSYSGKWNMHWDASATNDEMLRDFIARLAGVTPVTSTHASKEQPC